MTNPETLRSPETPETRQELDGLKLDISNRSKDYKEFESLSKNPLLKSGLNKLYNKSCELAFSEEWKRFEKLNIGKTIENILKKYPDLLFHISGELKLPLSERKFSNLSLQQKLNFTALYSAIFGKNILYKKNPSSQDIISRIRQNKGANFNKLNHQFERKNVKNLLDLEDTLKDFGLNSAEIGKVKEYLLLIKKHPEFAGINKPQEAGRIGYAIFLLVGVALGFLGKYYIDNMGKVETEKTTIVDGVLRIEEPESVLKLVTREANFEPITGRKELTPKTDDQLFFQITRKIPLLGSWFEEAYKDAQTREIIMGLEGRLGMQFDLEKGSQIDIDVKDGKGVVYVQLPHPDVIVTKTKAHVSKVDRELVHVSDYEQGQEELRQELEQQAIDQAKNNHKFYEEGEEDVAKQLYGIFSKVYKPVGIEITEVHVKFFNPEEGPKDYTDPEGRSIVNFK